MIDEIVTSYDQVPYASFPYPQSHPARLATVGRIFRMTPTPVENCRVLELGCAGGGNLIPMAQMLPNSRFVGVDLSKRQVNDGLATIKTIGLKNIELRAGSILDVDDSFGKFDYIICHGVFSWVPQEVKDKILSVCSKNLNPNGVAYVSYNTYPGWHHCEIVRRLMLYHTRGIKSPADQVKAGKELIEFIANSVPSENNPYGMLLKAESQRLQQKADYYLWHEHLEDINTPMYFHEFVALADKAGLQFLGEADVCVMSEHAFPPEVRKRLREMAPNIVKMEQYMDFLRNRTFRQTLLCSKSVPLSRKLSHECVRGLYVSTPAVPDSMTPSLAANVNEKFNHPKGQVLTTSDPLFKAAMLHLQRVWPRAVAFEELTAIARAAIEDRPVASMTPREEDLTLLGTRVMHAFTTNFMQLSAFNPTFSQTISSRPLASALARHQAKTSDIVTTLCHEVVKLSDFSRHLVTHLDGSRDRDALADAMVGLVQRNVLVVKEKGERVNDPKKARGIIAAAIEQNLPQLAERALLSA